jgi:light-regulated signal transduction histidine kinase (bacteriophytochrome)
MKKKGLNGTHNSIGTNLGKMAMDRLREQANAMIEAENKLLKIRTQRSEYIYHVTLLTSLLTNFISLLMIAAFLYVLRIHLIARQKSENILFEERELLRESEARFRKLSESLSRSNEELEQFAYVASHDLKEPLHTISSFADLFVRRYAAKMETKEKEYLDAIKQAALQGKTLVKELLEFSRIGKSQVLESVDLFETVQKVKVNLDMIIKESNAHIECSDHLPAVKCTSVEMGQLFQNLIENSIKYRSSEPPKIHISAVKSENNMWLLSVKDNGIGIDAEYKDRIFGIFERLHSRSEYAGTGIGLAICKKIVEHYGGRIWVESESGKGSLFCFTIPGLSSN